MVLEYELVLEDGIAMSMYQCELTGTMAEMMRKGRQMGWKWLTIGFVLAAAGIVAAVLEARGIWRAPSGVAAIAITVGGLMTWVGWSVLRPPPKPSPVAAPINPETRQRLEKTGLYSGDLGWHRLTIDDESLTEETEHATLVLRWSGVREIADRPSHVFVALRNGTAMTIPKRAIPAQIKADEVVELLRGYVPAAGPTPAANG